MDWLLLITVVSCVCSLTSAAPPTIPALELKGEKNDLEEIQAPPVANEDEIPTKTSVETPTEYKKNFSQEIVTENQNTTNTANHLEVNTSTLQVSRSVEPSETTVNKKETSEKEFSEATVRQIVAETSSQQSSEQPLEQTSAEQQGTTSGKPTGEPSGEASGETVTDSTTRTPATLSTTKKPKPNKPKPARSTTVKPLAVESPVTPSTAVVTVGPTSATVKPTKPTSSQRYPCRCADGTCSCCTGIILENFNVPLRSRACANVTYEPDEFAFNFRLAYNNIVLYNRRMSAKNPRPACIPINRYFGIKMCAKLSNVYMSGRNMHACLDFEGFFDDETAFKYSFNCFRIGSQGVAVVRPEDGGGLPPPPDEEEQIDEDYDDNARGWKSKGETLPK